MRQIARFTFPRRKLFVLCIAAALALALGSTAGRATTTPNPADAVHSFYDALLSTMKNGAALGDKGRYQALAPAVDRAFDVSYMAQRAVGTAWATFSPAQQERVTQAFARYITATYADRFDSYGGEKFEVIGERASSFGTIVQSRLVKSDGEPISIDYLMRESDGSWQIADVYLAATISQLATLRSQFSSVLARQGVDGLIAMLNQKAEMLIASAGAS